MVESKLGLKASRQTLLKTIYTKLKIFATNARIFICFLQLLVKYSCIRGKKILKALSLLTEIRIRAGI
jgi:hypothetical protein